VPAGAQINQVIAYWHGLDDTAEGGDSTAWVNGFEVTGSPLGVPTLFYKLKGIYPRYSIGFRADITQLGIIHAGDNALMVGGLDGYETANGFGVVVVYDDGREALIDLRDGTDNAFADFRAPLDTTVPQVFDFTPEQFARQAEVMFMVAGVAYRSRPCAISVSIDDGPAGILFDKIRSRDYLEWDTYVLPLTIPAGATRVTVRVLSIPDLPPAKPASLTWLSTALTISEPVDACQGTPLAWYHNPNSWGATGLGPNDDLASTFTTQYTALLPMWNDLLGDLSLSEVLISPAGTVPLGPVRELLREGTAAILNASSPAHNLAFPPELMKDVYNVVLSTHDLMLFQLVTEVLRTWNLQVCAPEQF